MELPAQARAVCETWLGEIDRLAPGLVTGLHIRGGLAFGEFVPGQSDIDFVAILSRRPDLADEDLLAASHHEVQARHPDLPFDGIHVTEQDLRSDPDDCPDVPCVLHGWFEPAGRYDVSPVAWHEIARHAIPVRGEKPQAVWTDDARLAEFTRENLATYWTDQAAALEKFPAEAAKEETCSWCVLGVARLHHLLVTGEMTGKSGAASWGLAHYDERFHRVLREALRIRVGDGARQYDGDEVQRARDTAAFTAYVVSS